MKLDKRHLHHVWRKFRGVKPWYFLVATIILAAICVVSLRHNNERMVELRSAVYTADKNGGDVETALRNLREYIYSHMNTGLSSGPNAVHPPIQLKYTYERLQAQQEAVLQQNNGAVYAQAQAACASQGITADNGLGGCIENYAAQQGVNLAPIPDSLYKYDFTAAKWSPDLAGWTLVLSILSGLCFIISALYHWWAKKYL